MTSYTFRLGDHRLATKRGHCAACSQVEARVTVLACDLPAALTAANAAIQDKAGFGLMAASGMITVSFAGPITARMLIKEES